MDHQQVQRYILDHDWSAADAQEARQALDHLDACESCRGALGQYDMLRRQLAGGDAGDEQPADGWGAFEERLAASAGRANRWRFARPVGLLAAGVLVMVTGWYAGLLSGSASRDRSDGAVHLVDNQLLPSDSADEVNVFRRVSEVFDHRAGWVSLSDAGSDMGLMTEPAAPAVAGSPAGNDLYVLRLTLTRGAALVAQTDLIILPQQEASLDLPCGQGRTLQYRAKISGSEPAMLALWAELIHDNGQREALAGVATHLRVEPGKVTRAVQLVTTHGEYQLNVGFRKADLTR